MVFLCKITKSGQAKQTKAKNKGDGGSKTKNFDIVDYGDKTPGLENHHGVLDIWATRNIDGYKSRASKSITIVLTQNNMQQLKQYIVIGCMKELVKKSEKKLIGRMYHQKKFKLYQKLCLMQQTYQCQQETIIIENSINTFIH